MQDYVAVVGAVNMDVGGRPFAPLIARDSNPGAVSLSPGGVGRNIAHNLRLLGVPAVFLTALGEDAFAQELRRGCAGLGIDLSHALSVPGAGTSVYLYIAGSDGDMALAVSDMALARHISPAYLERTLDVLDNAALVVLDGNLEAESVAWLGENCRAPLFADPVSVHKAERFRAVLPKLHTFKPNRMEAELLTGERAPEAAAQALLNRGVRRVFLSLGADGVLAAEGTTRVRLPAVPGALVNTTGAGDAMTAALAAAYLEGRDLEQSARLALAAAASAVASEASVNPAMCRESVWRRAGL